MSFFSMLRGGYWPVFRSRCLGVHFYNKPIIHQSSVVRYLLLVYPWTSAIRSVSLILWVVPGISPTRAINHRIVFPIKIKWEMLSCALWMPVVMFTAAALTPGQTCTTWARHCTRVASHAFLWMKSSTGSQWGQTILTFRRNGAIISLQLH